VPEKVRVIFWAALFRKSPMVSLKAIDVATWSEIRYCKNQKCLIG
jgi:hypothetical protein